MAKFIKTVVDYDGPNEVIVWQHRIQQCAGETEVIVPFSHEVVFIKDGQMLDTMSEGKHTISLPVKKGIGPFAKDVSEPFRAQVFFVNKTVTMVIPWGTPNQIRIVDPFLQYPVNVGASGSFDISVANSRKFVSKVVGNTAGLNTEGLQRFFADKMIMRVKDVLANAMVTSRINFYELPTKLLQISGVIKETVRNLFDDYGIKIVDFSINDIKIPDSELREMEQIIKQKRILEMKDSSYKDEREAHRETLKLAADAAVRMAEVNAVKPEKTILVADVSAKYCGQCGTKVPLDATFCHKCGAKL